MHEAISDTGPIFHLSEIDRLGCLDIFERVYLPTLVADELESFELGANDLGTHVNISIVPVSQQQRERVLQHITPPPIHLADAEVFALARDENFPNLILTDDLSLRHHLEQHNLLVVGSVGILVRAYHKGLLSHTTLNDSIDALFHDSTLHASPAFRVYVRNLVENLE